MATGLGYSEDISSKKQWKSEHELIQKYGEEEGRELMKILKRCSFLSVGRNV